jgi:hypothetical protein
VIHNNAGLSGGTEGGRMASLLGCTYGFAFVGCLKVVIGLVVGLKRNDFLIVRKARIVLSIP